MLLCTGGISFSLLVEVKSGGGGNVEEATRVASLFLYFFFLFFWRFLTNVMPRWCAAHFNAHCYCHAHSSVHGVGEGGGGGGGRVVVRSVGDGRAAITNC